MSRPPGRRCRGCQLCRLEEPASSLPVNLAAGWVCSLQVLSFAASGTSSGDASPSTWKYPSVVTSVILLSRCHCCCCDVQVALIRVIHLLSQGQRYACLPMACLPNIAQSTRRQYPWPHFSGTPCQACAASTACMLAAFHMQDNKSELI